MKIFCFADCHGFYHELIDALDKAGFDKGNPDHMAVGCGDFFDRGPDPTKVMEYMQSLPRKVLITGNHEDLLMDLMQRGYPTSHDVHNGTIETVYELDNMDSYPDDFHEACHRAYRNVKPFIFSMENYFETQHYVFTHGWIPIKINDGLPSWYQHDRKYEMMEDWRNASQPEWMEARWRNGIQLASDGFTIEKPIVCGHWHCSTGHAMVDGTPEFGPRANFDPYYGDGIIAIDGCTAASGKVNVVVFEDELLV